VVPGVDLFFVWWLVADKVIRQTNMVVTVAPFKMTNTEAASICIAFLVIMSCALSSAGEGCYTYMRDFSCAMSAHKK
jgi:hypothetical protein